MSLSVRGIVYCNGHVLRYGGSKKPAPEDKKCAPVPPGPLGLGKLISMYLKYSGKHKAKAPYDDVPTTDSSDGLLTVPELVHPDKI